MCPNCLRRVIFRLFFFISLSYSVKVEILEADRTATQTRLARLVAASNNDDFTSSSSSSGPLSPGTSAAHQATAGIQAELQRARRQTAQLRAELDASRTRAAEAEATAAVRATELSELRNQLESMQANHLEAIRAKKLAEERVAAIQTSMDRCEFAATAAAEAASVNSHHEAQAAAMQAQRELDTCRQELAAQLAVQQRELDGLKKKVKARDEKAKAAARAAAKSLEAAVAEAKAESEVQVRKQAQIIEEQLRTALAESDQQLNENLIALKTAAAAQRELKAKSKEVQQCAQLNESRLESELSDMQQERDLHRTKAQEASTQLDARISSHAEATAALKREVQELQEALQKERVAPREQQALQLPYSPGGESIVYAPSKAAHNAELHALHEQIARLEVEHAATNEGAADMKAKLEHRCTQLQEQVVAVETDMAAKAQQWKKKEESYKEELRSAQAQLEEALTTAAKFEVEAVEASVTMTSASADVEVSKKKAQRAEEAATSAQARVSALEEELNDFRLRCSTALLQVETNEDKVSKATEKFTADKCKAHAELEAAHALRNSEVGDTVVVSDL